MGIIQYTVPKKATEYDALVAKELADLLEATAKDENSATQFSVPAVDEGRVASYFADAANEKGKTARFRVRTYSDVDAATKKAKLDKNGKAIGTVTFIITLSEKHAPRRGKDSAEGTKPAAPAAPKA